MGSCTEDKVQTVWDWCSDAYLRHGRKLTYPANTDIHKTYQWRYVKAIAQKFDTWGFDDSTSRKFIDIAVGYAKQRGTLHKGLAVLHRNDMLEICYNILQKQADKNTQNMNTLIDMKKWFDSQTNNDYKVLLQRITPKAFPNIIIWYRANKISELFMACSKDCMRALAELQKTNQDEYRLLPTLEQLFLLRMKIDNIVAQKLKLVFRSDWREMCQ